MISVFFEKSTAFVSYETDWLEQRKDWKNLCCIGAIHTEFTTKKGVSSEWHYYISSRKLTAKELLHHARMEWTVETMHWFLDVHFEEDWCRIEDKTVQQNLNMFRKAAINFIKQFKSQTNSTRAVSNIMFDCLLDPKLILFCNLPIDKVAKMWYTKRGDKNEEEIHHNIGKCKGNKSV